MSLGSARRHYRKAPIVEAVIDLQIDTPHPTLKQVQKLADRLADQYASRVPINQLQMGFQLPPDSAGAEFSSQQSILGWRFDNSNKDRVLQLRTTGFTYSHLAPYSDWVTFSKEAEALWTEYVRDLHSERVRRTGVRIINKLPEMPQDAALIDYLNLFPVIPNALPSSTRAMLLQLQILMPDLDPDGVLSLGLYSDQANENQMILDIDLFVQRSISANEEVFSLVNRLGDAKDVVFEACITDKIREVIQ
jgi:uncharacterized protein (TIGR04255 family)